MPSATALPPFLYGSYKRYKADTAAFVHWLVGAAKESGHEATLQLPATASKGRTKGKKSKATSEQSTPEINLEELVTLAHAVSNSSQKIPSAIVTTARRAIALRKRCSQRFTSGRKETKVDPDGHSHFVTVMEQLCDLLEGKSGTTSAARSQGNATTTGPSDAESKILNGNRFSQLTCEDVAEDDEIPPVTPTTATIEISEDEDDKDSQLSLRFFGLYCLFEDLQLLRNFVAQSVAEYAEGEIDPMNLAVTTDTAVNLAKQLIDEVVTSWPELEEDQQVQQFLYRSACACRGEDPDANHRSGLPFNINMTEVAHWCYFQTSILLMSFREVIQPNSLPVFKKGHFGTYNSRACRDGMTEPEMFKEDKVILFELLPEFTFMHMFGIVYPAQDEITKALVKFMDDKKVPVSLCFATQILLDVHHGLRLAKDKAFNDLRFTSIRITKTVEEHWKFSKTFKDKATFWPIEGETKLKEVHKCIDDVVTNDMLLRCKTLVVGGKIPAELSAAGGFDKHYLFRSHAILSGLMMFHLTLRMQDIGLALVNSWYDIPETAYLYNLIQQTGIKGLRWQDMDAFIEIHGEEHIFIGGRPTTIEDSQKKLNLAAGISSASDFARRGRSSSSRTSPASSASVRRMHPSIAVANIFLERYLQNGPSKISVDNVDKLLDKVFSNRRSSPATAHSNEGFEELLQNNWKTTHRLGALQLLAAIKRGLYIEEPHLHFNYFGLHQRCIELLRQIQTKEHEKFVQYFGANYMPNDTLVANLVLLNHTVAYGAATNRKQMGIPEGAGGIAIMSRMVMSCEEVLEAYLRTHGDTACKELRAFCKNESLCDVKGFARKPIHPDDYKYVLSVGAMLSQA